MNANKKIQTAKGFGRAVIKAIGITGEWTDYPDVWKEAE